MPKARVGDPETRRQISKAPAAPPAGDPVESLRAAQATEPLADQDRPSDVIPAPDIPGTLEPLLAGTVQEAKDTDDRRVAAEEEDLATSRLSLDAIEGGINETVQDIDAERASLLGTEADVMARLRGADEQIQAIPGEVTSQFEKLRGEFDSLAAGAFDRLDAEKAQALEGIQAGKNEALSAAVNGIQGNINQAIAQIQGDPNLTSAQKASMISRTRMSGAMALAPAVGAHVLEFNTLSANTATAFANIGGNIQNQILSSQGQLIGQQGAAFAQAQVAVGQLTTKLLETEANSAVNFANAQTQLIAARSLTINSGHQLMLQGLSEFRTPYANYTDAWAIGYAGTMNIMKTEFQQALGLINFDIMATIAAQQEGDFVSNFVDATLSTFAATGNPLLSVGAGAAAGGTAASGPSIGDFIPNLQ